MTERVTDEGIGGKNAPIVITNADDDEEKMSVPSRAPEKRSLDDTTAHSTVAHAKRARSEQEETTSSVVEIPIKLFATVHVEQQSKKHPIRSQCRTLRELLGFDDDSSAGNLSWIVVANYIIDFAFFLQEVPELLSMRTATVFYGHADTPGSIWQNAAVEHTAVELVPLNPSDPPRSASNPLQQRIAYGVHHSKIFLVGRSNGSLRLVVHTANLRHNDIHLKAQAAYVQDFCLKSSKTDSPPTSSFEQDLVSYFQTYQYHKPRLWNGTTRQSLVECLRQYDFSTATGVLIPSTPGYHRLDAEPAARRGHWKLRYAIEQHCPRVADASRSPRPTPPPPPVVCQFSSMGSLTEKYLQQLQDSMDVATVHRPRDERPPAKKPPLALRLVYPTVEEVRTSVEGYRGGNSVPGTAKNVQKPFLRPLYHRWSSSTAPSALEMGHNIPHIKTYYQIRPAKSLTSSMEYFVVTSHNLSKAAWGEIQNTRVGRRLFVRHWELGVFVSPSLLKRERLVPWSSEASSTQDAAAVVPLPYPLLPSRYQRQDQPWAVDNPFHDQADRFGRHSA